MMLEIGTFAAKVVTINGITKDNVCIVRQIRVTLLSVYYKKGDFYGRKN